MADVTGLSIAGVVLGTISLLIVCGYLIIINFILPSYKNGALPWADIGGYACIFGLALLFPINFAFSSMVGSENTTPQINNALIITLTILLSVINVVIGYTAYLKIGKSMTGTLDYLEVGLPANLLVSIVAVAMIMMNTLASV
jgi:hypothetical protein